MHWTRSIRVITHRIACRDILPDEIPLLVHVDVAYSEFLTHPTHPVDLAARVTYQVAAGVEYNILTPFICYSLDLDIFMKQS